MNTTWCSFLLPPFKKCKHRESTEGIQSDLKPIIEEWQRQGIKIVMTGISPHPEDKKSQRKNEYPKSDIIDQLSKKKEYPNFKLIIPPSKRIIPPSDKGK